MSFLIVNILLKLCKIKEKISKKKTRTRKTKKNYIVYFHLEK